MRRLAALFGTTIALAAPACDLEPPEEYTLRLDHYRAPCPDGQPGYCLRVLEGGDPRTPYARDIAGFDHVWGTTYEVRVLLAPGTSDVPSYDLVEVIGEDRVDPASRFELEIPPAFVERIGTSRLDLVGRTTAVCTTPEVCDAVALALDEDAPVHLDLSHDPNRAGTFLAHAASIRR